MTVAPEAVVLRHDLRAGDIGWVIHRHGVVYAREHGWDPSFEAYVAKTMVGFGLRHDPERERLWLAELDGRTVGSIAIVSAEDDAAQLRWFLVEPECRGMGVGRRLIDEALSFCRATGRRRVFLLTVAGLEAAAHLYAKAGFRLVSSVPAHHWGADVVDERWELDLATEAEGGA
jgi:N-acetylglutamate synthase-like GNAT family acetyltransferase